MKEFAAACFGAAFQGWWSLRRKLEQKRYAALIRSKLYWIVAVVMVFGAAGGSVIWYADVRGPVPLFHYVAVAAAFPSIFKRIVDIAANANDSAGFGVGSLLKDYFKGG